MRIPVITFRFLKVPGIIKFLKKRFHIIKNPGPEKSFKRAYKKGRTAVKYRDSQCLNCEYPLAISHKYCPHCSQLNSHKKLGIKDFFEELFSNLFSYDSKLRRTLTLMLFRPGKITRSYISGKRMTYANPFRFFLSLAIVYFFLLNCSNNFTALDRLGVNNQKDGLNFVNDDGMNWKLVSKKDQKKFEEGVNVLNNEEINMPDIDSIQREREKNDAIRLRYPVVYFDSIRQKSWLERFSLKVDFFQSGIRKQKISIYREAVDSLHLKDTYENKLAFNSAGSLVKATNRPGSYLSFIISKLPFIIFFFLPVFAVFIWLIYSRKKFSYIDHLIFSFHTQTMLIILLIISFIIELIFNTGTLSIWFLLLFLFYLYKAMRNFYGQRRLKTIVKFMFLNSIFFILATVTIIFFFIGSIFTY